MQFTTVCISNIATHWQIRSLKSFLFTKQIHVPLRSAGGQRYVYIYIHILHVYIRIYPLYIYIYVYARFFVLGCCGYRTLPPHTLPLPCVRPKYMNCCPTQLHSSLANNDADICCNSTSCVVANQSYFIAKSMQVFVPNHKICIIIMHSCLFAGCMHDL